MTECTTETTATPANPSPTQLAMAKRMINASICAYQIHPQGWIPSGPQPPVLRTIQGPNGDYFYNVVPTYQDAVGFVATAAQGYAPIFVAAGVDDIDAALVGAMSDGNLVIALRGTIPPSFSNNDIIAWIEDWLQNGDCSPTPWRVTRGPRLHSVKVDAGFADAALTLWRGIADAIRTTLATTPCTGVVITGHSKGAALSFLLATMVQLAFPGFKGKIQVHAFAPPVVGNTAFCKQYASLGIPTFRYQVEHDLVPFLALWPEADFYATTVLPDTDEEILWVALALLVADVTDGGYDAVGSFIYFDSHHQLVPGALVTSSALPAVTKALEAGDMAVIADAHSAVSSYLPCF